MYTIFKFLLKIINNLGNYNIFLIKRVKKNTVNSAKKIIVWALYDDAESSYKKAIKKYFHGKIEVHSIGINNISFKEKENYFYHKIDLSLNNHELINELKKLPHPDVILASPPCESWSGADCNGKMFRSINKNFEWIVKNRIYYDEYNKNCHPVKKRYFAQKERGRILGESTIGGTIEIIEYFNPKVWIIENPKTSKTWEFQLNHWDFPRNKKYYMNSTFYSSYDENFSAKPTIFKSNIKLNLKENKVSGNKNHMAKGSYSRRSSIPELLIKDIISQIMENDYGK
ncbi:hypothetical protein [Malacoplasma iowae]|uniref:Putative C5 DNA methylase n=1 Tax=Malacoplasma iowae DK-CPA TaxID=1394179 RepID=A0A084U4J9_MALIO|nr:hypothetical protein [Malacoplasma iowae]KFB07885.1 putative C5 DNA methylase [Malacoplasma iowae DK-CPA]WPL36754.1 DNA methyltransferase [Malacoplasma iowae]WPL40060.1 DNA methyltransferase [Malacoplasma iowae]WPL40523.1 DNA methyltransferase [Malacoplasma iowae]